MAIKENLCGIRLGLAEIWIYLPFAMYVLLLCMFLLVLIKIKVNEIIFLAITWCSSFSY